MKQTVVANLKRGLFVALAIGSVWLLAGGMQRLVGGSSVTPAQAREKLVPPSRAAVQYSFAPIVRKAAPAVVNIYVRSRVRKFTSPFARDPFFRRFFGDRFGRRSERMQSSLGSGVIISADGVIVTNTHVIKARGKTQIKVALADKREFDARVIANDEKTDIAILKIDNGDEKFPYLAFEDSDTLEVGDLVLAIGNPFGVGQTVTSGIVSALARSQIKSDAVFIQTDAAINPGNSGGALVDMSGRLVGINTAIFSKSGGSHGIGFAIPSNLVRLIADSGVEGRKVERPWLGARLAPVTRDVAQALGLKRVAGALVDRVFETGPAEQAGLEPGDVITSVDGFEVSDARAVTYRLTTRGIGETSQLRVVRDNKSVDVELVLQAAPELDRGDVRNVSGKHPFDGARIANIVPTVAEELRLDGVEGIAVLSVQRGSQAARFGFRRGDVISEIDQSAIASLRDLDDALAQQRRSRYWLVKVRRGSRTRIWRLPRYRR